MNFIKYQLLITLFSITIASAQVDLSYYLPDSVSYNQSIPKPASIIGHQVGEWHVTHDKLVYYMKALAAASERITLIETGKTYEHRPQLLLTISHPENQNTIESIRKEHKLLTNPEQSESLDISKMPAVVWMGYSVHGNEPSGSNAAILTAYYLAAAEGAAIEAKLRDVIVVLDPSFNPDGLNRFATWANMHKSKKLVTDPNDREFNEAWPGGRTNHYWFDLNRDWLPAQLIESQNRVKWFHEWKPNIMTDHHEMGTNSTFFFQPGIPSRTHPLTPQLNQDLTAQIGAYHANFLDQAGSLYYTKESYDDFYYGKGSTFPDVQGAIGILFEQASSRGHAQESENGILTFPFTIKNQFITSLSTYQAAYEMREELLNYQRNFYLNATKEADEAINKAWIVSDKDASKLHELGKLLQRHEVEVYQLKNNYQEFKKEHSLIIPTQQYQTKLIQAMFEKRTSFQDSLFYDVSAWTLPLAFNIDYKSLSGKAFNKNLIGDKFNPEAKPSGQIIGGKSQYAYLLKWDDYFAPKALFAIQQAGLDTKVATKSFTDNKNNDFEAGTILIPVKQQKISPEKVYQVLNQAIKNTNVQIYATSTGNMDGVNLGSRTFETLEQPSIMMLVGDGISPYDAGEIWHLADQRYAMPITKLETSNFGRADISRYNTILIPSARITALLKSNKYKIENWLKAGGRLIAFEQAVKSLADAKISQISFWKDSTKSSDFKLYEDYGNERGAKVIGGAIFETKLDLSHPINFGYHDSKLAVFKGNNLFMNLNDNAYASPVRYVDDPLMSGYISPQNLDVLKNKPAINIEGKGRGKIISFSENPNFRAFWYGTNRLMINAIFFGDIISSGTVNK